MNPLAHDKQFDPIKMLMAIERKIGEAPDAKMGDDCFPLEHFYLDGLYVRKISMPAGYILTSKIHKQTHPYFILEGEVEVLTEDGKMTRISAPFFGITRAGTKRVILTHSDTVWITCHANPTNTRDLKKIEEAVIAKSFKDIPKSFPEAKEEINVDSKAIF